MSTGFDGLLDFLLSEIALCGVQGMHDSLQFFFVWRRMEQSCKFLVAVTIIEGKSRNVWFVALHELRVYRQRSATMTSFYIYAFESYPMQFLPFFQHIAKTSFLQEPAPQTSIDLLMLSTSNRRPKMLLNPWTGAFRREDLAGLSMRTFGLGSARIKIFAFLTKAKFVFIPLLSSKQTKRTRRVHLDQRGQMSLHRLLSHPSTIRLIYLILSRGCEILCDNAFCRKVER